jgi:hypothetical protein
MLRISQSFSRCSASASGPDQGGDGTQPIFPTAQSCPDPKPDRRPSAPDQRSAMAQPHGAATERLHGVAPELPHVVAPDRSEWRPLLERRPGVENTC